MHDCTSRCTDVDPYRFILNGLVHANEILGEEAFKVEDWKVIGEYVYDEEGGRHQAFYSPLRDVIVLGETIRAQERIQVEQSLKYSQTSGTKLWNGASLEEVDHWMLGQEYGKSTPSSILSYFLPQSPRGRLIVPRGLLLESYDTPRSSKFASLVIHVHLFLVLTQVQHLSSARSCVGSRRQKSHNSHECGARHAYIYHYNYDVVLIRISEPSGSIQPFPLVILNRLI